MLNTQSQNFLQFQPFADISLAALKADEAACGHYRVVYPVEFLRRGGARVSLLEKGNWDQLANHDVLLLQRMYTPEFINTMRDLKRMGKTLIYEIDDNVHAVHPGSTAYREYKPGSPTLRRVEEAMGLCDGLFVTTPELASHYSGYCQRVYVIPNCIDYGIRDWSGTTERDEGLEAKKAEVREKTGREPIVVGWAGSITHQDDMVFGPGIRTMLEKYPHVIFAVCSAYRVMDIFERQLALNKDLAERFVRINPVDFVDYPKIPANFDIGLVMVSNTPFNQDKSPLKILEYGALGVPYVASVIAPYLRFHRETDGQGGYLVSSKENGLHRLIEDEEDRRTKGEFLRSYIRENYSYERGAHRWADAIREVHTQAQLGINTTRQVYVATPKRNDPCPCGSGLKHKKCQCYGAWGYA